jgi:hypothetical protein
MGRVASRLKSAGIELDDSQAITFLARSDESPFCGLIERGLSGDDKDLLQWNVFSSLISIFRELAGGKLYHEKNDYAALWRTKYLASSGLVSNFAESGVSNAFEHWSKLDGPWRPVFMRFFTNVRDYFGDTYAADKHNYWGKTRISNLFNKVSLTILAADFFQYLCVGKKTIDTISQIDELFADWLENVNRGYFDRDWNLTGIKKDTPGIRAQWAFQWCEYRKNPGTFPNKSWYRQSK